MAPQEGLEPTTLRLTAECSAIELLRLKIRRRPTLPGRVQPSTIGAEGLNFCVRYGNRWDPFAIVTGNCCIFVGPRSVISHSSYLPKVSVLPLRRLPLLTALASAFRAARPFSCILRCIKFNACYDFASAFRAFRRFLAPYSRPLSHLDNRTIWNPLALISTSQFFEIKPSTY